MNQPSQTEGKRRSRRFPFLSPVEATWQEKDGKIVRESGQATEVNAQGGGATMTARQATVFLLPRNQSQGASDPARPGQLDRILARGNVVVSQPSRWAKGEQLVYTAADDKFVLTGGPPSIFDAERGQTTGESLTFFRRDDRVLVEGTNSSPTVTKARVAR